MFSKENQKDILILGNGAVALSAIKTIRARDKRVNIAVASKENLPFYSPVILPYYIQGKLPKSKLFPLGFEFYEKHSVEIFFGKKIQKLVTKSKQVLLDDGSQLTYEKLIIGTGASPFIPPIKGIKNKGIFSLRTVNDADLILGHLLRRVAIIGAGPVGIGLAIALRKRGLEVIVLDQISVSQLLGGMVDIEIAKEIIKHLEEKGIEIVLNQNALHTEIYGNPVKGIKGDTLDIKCDTVILATGIKPNLDFINAQEISLGKKGGILVDDHMMTCCKDVYAGGDCVEAVNFITGIKESNPIWPNAIEQGRIGALNAIGIDIAYKGFIKENVVNLFDQCLFIAGEMQGERKCIEEKGKTTRMIIQDGVVKGCQILGFPEKYGIYIAMIKDRFQPDHIYPISRGERFLVPKYRERKRVAEAH
jgi:NADPH-dependent 2,4-dienoyl-CoA reductase/sulfur reductase-like enzyme